MNEEAWLSRLLAAWLGAFGGLLAFLYMLFIGCEIGGRTVFELIAG